MVSLRDDDARAWLFEEPWNEVLEREPDAGLLIKVLQGDFQPSQPSSVTAFLATLDAEEESALSALLETKAPRNPLTIAHDCWREIERRQVRRQIEAVQARLRAPDLDAKATVNYQKQILDLQNRLSDIARPFSPPL